MSEELRNEEVLEETAEETVEAAETETMDDYADQLDVDPVWVRLENMLKDQTVINVEVGGIVKAGLCRGCQRIYPCFSA